MIRSQIVLEEMNRQTAKLQLAKNERFTAPGNPAELVVCELRMPGTAFYATRLIFHSWGTVICGDVLQLQTGSPHYGLEWFANGGAPLGHDYLAEKFLGNRDEWNAADCLKMVREFFKDKPAESEGEADARRELKAALKNGEIGPEGVYERGPDCGWRFDDGVPGYYYPRTETGWLAAIQQRFAELYQLASDGSG